MVLLSAISRRAKAVSPQLRIIALDRTQWKENNVLMVSVIFLPKRYLDILVLVGEDGSSNPCKNNKCKHVQ